MTELEIARNHDAEPTELPMVIHRGEWRITLDDVRRASAAALAAAEQRNGDGGMEP